MNKHMLKVNPKYWAKYLEDKSWSIRKNDRNYLVGDLCFFEKPGDPREAIIKQITEILSDKEFPDGIKPGYVILTLKLNCVVKCKP